MNNLIQIPVVFGTPHHKADNSVKLQQVTTREYSTDEYLQIHQLRNQTGWLVFSPGEQDITMDDVPMLKIPVDNLAGEKSPSQRLRALIYKNWELNTDQKNPFDTYYRQVMDKLCTTIKSNLP